MTLVGGQAPFGVGYSEADIAIEFFRSALTVNEAQSGTSEILRWIQEKNAETVTSISIVPLTELKQWKFEPGSGNIVHSSGRFFSIEGVAVETNWGNVPTWQQPIINQPEIGFLGILTKRIGGVLHFLMQAKIEPGNLHKVQLSPTLQATKSNYTRVHKGSRPLFLEYFNGEKPSRVLLDQLQSEQGARFLRKRNRNIIVQISDEELNEVPENFVWLTLGQIKALLRFDNIVNMDSRSVVSGISFGSHDPTSLRYLLALAGDVESGDSLLSSMLDGATHLHDFRSILSWLTDLKSRFDLTVRSIPLRDVEGWVFDGGQIRHRLGRYFTVIGVSVSIGNREVVSWDQPMIRPAQEGILAFLVKRIGGVYHFLVQAKLEAGNFDVVEFAPTVQCLTGNYRVGESEYSVPFLSDVLNAAPEQIWYSAMQSEEGGRFFEEQNRNVIVEVGDSFPIAVPDNYCWMTLPQLHTFMMFNNFLNIAARSLISALAPRGGARR